MEIYENLHDSIGNNLTKEHVDLFRKIAQNNNSLSVSQVQNRSEYRRIIKLIRSAALDIPGTTLFYLEDFIEENIVKSRCLKKRLRVVYGRFLRIKNWRQVTIVFRRHSINNQTILLVEKKKINNTLKDYLAKIELDNKNKNVSITLRNEKYEHEPPIFLDKKNGKTRIRSLSYKTYFPIRKHIYIMLNEFGKKKRVTILRKNEKVISDSESDSVSTKKDDLLRIYYDIQGLNVQSRYISISMNLRAFLLYIVHEDDVIEFDKSVDCLARAGKFENKTENIYRYDSNSKSNDTYQIEIQDYSVVEDFPFLSPEYNNFKHLLPIDRTFKVLKRIGNDLKKDLELLSLEQLKYEVTKKFFEFIKEYAESKSVKVDGSRKSLLKYCKQIRRYLKIKKTAHAINCKTLYEVKEEQLRQQDLLHGLHKLIAESNRDIIPIDRIIKSSKLKFGVQYILESIERNFGQKYVITQTCIISRSKADALRSLLSNLPLCENAHKILLDNGIPRRCLSYNGSLDNIVEKLGFYTRRVLISSDYLHYIDVVFQNVPKELRSPPPYWFLNTRFGRLQPFSNDRHDKYCTITYPINLYDKQSVNSFSLKTIQDSSKIAELRSMAARLIPNNK